MQASAFPTPFTRPLAALARLILTLACMAAVASCTGGDSAADGDGDGDGAAIVLPKGVANPPLYRITNAQGDVEGWMLGTIHALPDNTDWRTPAISNIIEEADNLIVEVAELDDQAAIAATFGNLATTPDLGPLPPRVAPALRDPLKNIIARSGFGSDRFDDTESWAAAIMLARVDAQGKPQNGVDRIVIREFADREVIGLETAEKQLRIFDSLSQRDQRDLLEGTVREWLDAKDKPGRLMRAWLTGDDDALIGATTGGIMADPELREALLTGRNERWIAPILARLNAAPKPLIAVGAAHLIGDEGLSALLTARGFTVERIE